MILKSLVCVEFNLKLVCKRKLRRNPKQLISNTWNVLLYMTFFWHLNILSTECTEEGKKINRKTIVQTIKDCSTAHKWGKKDNTHNT